VQGAYGDQLAPVNRLANFVNRNWTDNNHNFFPDCDLTNVNAQSPTTTGSIDTCGAMSTGTSAAPHPARPSIRTPSPGSASAHNWEFAAGVQHQVLPRMSVDIGYFRRWFGNFSVVDNRALEPCGRLRDVQRRGAGRRAPAGRRRLHDQQSYNINANKAGQIDNYFTLASDYGNQIQRWNGMDLTLNARPGRGVLLQGGLSSGRQITDNCEILAKVPEVSGAASPTGLPYCHQEQHFLTQVKFLGSYLLPKIDVQVSGTFQSIPGPQISANQVLSSAAVQPSLGRPLAGAATVTVNLVPPGRSTGTVSTNSTTAFRLLRYGNRARRSISTSITRSTSTRAAENATYSNATATGWRVLTTPSRAVREDQRPVRLETAAVNRNWTKARALPQGIFFRKLPSAAFSHHMSKLDHRHNLPEGRTRWPQVTARPERRSRCKAGQNLLGALRSHHGVYASRGEQPLLSGPARGINCAYLKNSA
jgi:hypothetical protein